MNLYAVSIAYGSPEILMSGFAQGKRTMGAQVNEWVLVNNHWPLLESYAHEAVYVSTLSEQMRAKVVNPDKNIGGHDGLTFGLKALDFKDHDFILNYDLDSWPVTPGWLTAMVQVMQADPSLGFVALLDNRCKTGKKWKVETIAGHQVGFQAEPDMWNVTLFRGLMLRDGMVADSIYYGFVETAMGKRLEQKGLRMGWLMDFNEDPHPIPHPAIYTEYKRLHAGKEFMGSFEEYLVKKGKV